MNKLLFALFAVFCCFAVASADIWSFCDGQDPTTFTFQVSTLTLTPDPPVIGMNATVNVAGNFTEEITGGSSTFVVQYQVGNSWISLPSFTSNVCDSYECPIQPGPVTRVESIFVPSFTPHGNYRGQLEVTDQSGNTITCIQFVTSMN
ncbi:hypothetical protein DFA_08523 [Cavenderia fasciculata]|uniref:MD-2-related lipid-recognition domain-containing protein n=1 Tax=Cavenderia fasciculata TaxID=261658 RepID=F4Q2R0_CACFS|nr:uncharacterized protein DFA_08523 [Cavenderia fasciculata]EGG17527.1 hypothetical protein DFA_08523 [Cavenderia fasciculata]|eukprot:XP_004356011.1 hypothetical protein DFA_08523 [Cavenderia fasciculata]